MSKCYGNNHLQHISLSSQHDTQMLCVNYVSIKVEKNKDSKIVKHPTV